MPTPPADLLTPVLVVTSFGIPHVGGASTHIELLARALRERGRLQSLIALGNFAGRRSVGYLLRRITRPDAAIAAALEEARDVLERAIRAELALNRSCTVVHAHDPLAAAAASRARGPGVALVHTIHGPWSRENATMHRRPRPRHQATVERIEREAFAAADGFIAVDQGQADLVARDFLADPSRVAVIANAVDVDELPARGRSGVPEPFLLVPRRLVPKNGVEFAIRAFAGRGELPRLVIAGDGPLRSELEALTRQLGAERRVTFLGDVDRPRLLPMIAAATAVVVPSVPVNGVVEATSLAVLEAMGSRVPVIGSAIGGIAEIMAPGCGILVPPGDTAALARAMEEVVAMAPSARTALGENARARVQSAYGVGRWLTQTATAYRAALARVGGAE
jgi:glycosyltransferase involved in cell wall biosynthesis